MRGKMPKLLKHRFPTNKTIKELYANAYCCAFPGCNRPLYKIDNENGIRTLNSNAAHICARSECGPRWDKNQTEDENRSVNNLLALCLEHAFEIDEIKKKAQYPIEKLRQWKKEQLADFDSLGKQGWSVRTEDFAQLKNHFNNVQIIDIGGKGGSSPGAGGGGGGVYGSSHSKGGDGGKGGDKVIFEGSNATFPSAGGGGAGVFGDDAVAAGGGEGGEICRKFINAEDCQYLEFEIGSGGKSDQDGRDTIVKIIDNKNKVIDTIQAKGGKAGHPGSHGDVSSFARALTKEEFDGGSRITTILLADCIYLKDGLSYVLGAGWDLYKAPNFPCSIPLPLLLFFSFPNLNVPSVINCNIRVKNSDNEILIEEFVNFKKLDVNLHRVSHVTVLEIKAIKCDVWAVEIITGDILLASYPITISVS